MRKYDIFISCKNSDNGRVTEDVGIAETLYRRLTKEGFSVFLSWVALKSIGSPEYKKVIDEALDGASVLIVVATNAKHVTSRWVEYEWNSFQSDGLSGRGKVRKIFTVTKGMSAGELPFALRSLQNFPYDQDGAVLDEIAEFVRNALAHEEPQVETPPSAQPTILSYLFSRYIKRKDEKQTTGDLPAEEAHHPLPDWIMENIAEDRPERSSTERSSTERTERSGTESAKNWEVTTEYIFVLGLAVKLGQVSISFIQRKCSIGYNHAAKIFGWMEDMGYISPFDGTAKTRTVLLTKEEYESKYGPLD